MKLSAQLGSEVIQDGRPATVKERCAQPAMPFCLTCKDYLRKAKDEKKHGQDGSIHVVAYHCMAHGYEVYANGHGNGNGASKANAR